MRIDRFFSRELPVLRTLWEIPDGDSGDTPEDNRNRPDDDQGIPLPPDEQPPEPINDPPLDPEQAPIDEGPKGPKKIV
jgi:hypothetical protein